MKCFPAVLNRQITNYCVNNYYSYCTTVNTSNLAKKKLFDSMRNGMAEGTHGALTAAVIIESTECDSCFTVYPLV